MTHPAAQARAVLSISTLLSLNEHQKLLHGSKKKALKWENKTLTVNTVWSYNRNKFGGNCKLYLWTCSGMQDHCMAPTDVLGNHEQTALLPEYLRDSWTNSAIFHTHLKPDKPCLIPEDVFYLDPAGVKYRKWTCDKIIKRKPPTSHWEARCNCSVHTSPNSAILTKLTSQLPFQTGLLISTLLIWHTMKLHMATVVKMKNKKRKSFQYAMRQVKYWNIYFDGTKPSSLLLFLLPHTNPATHTDIGENVLLICLCQFIQHKVNSWVNILDVIMLNSSKVHTEVNTKYSYWSKILWQPKCGYHGKKNYRTSTGGKTILSEFWQQLIRLQLLVTIKNACKYFDKSSGNEIMFFLAKPEKPQEQERGIS